MKKMTLTLRCTASQAKEIKKLTSKLGHNAHSKSVLHAALSFVGLLEAHRGTQADLRELQGKYDAMEYELARMFGGERRLREILEENER